MRKVLLCAVASFAAAGFSPAPPSDAPAAPTPGKGQTVVEMYIVCRSSILMQDGKAVSVKLVKCVFIPPAENYT